MCGIFGVAIKKNAKYETNFILKSFRELATLSEIRGSDSSGILFRNENQKSIDIYKGPIPVSKLLNHSSVKTHFNGIKHSSNSRYDANYNFFAMGHARLVTNGTQLKDVNNQPVVKDGVVGIHNGIIVNVNEIWEKRTELKRSYDIDTEILLSLINLYRNKDNINNSVAKSIMEIYGTVSAAVIFDDTDELLIFTNNGSLYVLTNFEDFLIFASENHILRTLVDKNKIYREIGEYKILQVEPDTGYIINLFDFSCSNFRLNANEKFRESIPKPSLNAEKPFTSCTPRKSQKLQEKYKINISSIKDTKTQKSVLVDYASIALNPNMEKERSLLLNPVDAVRKLKRCTACLLPETFPFIHFDRMGVCNYCTNYVKKNRADDLAALEKLISPYLKKNSEHDCIIPFSGGRDSTFSLHILKRELKINPITYTYDWGMVTDLARRNIARVCGKLGVENIIVSANLNKKRRNIRLNVSAWLKKPELSMVPLFMAGDKSFHHYLLKLKKQTGLNLNIWGTNYLENTDFKVGFNGVFPEFEKKNLYSLSLFNQLRLYKSLALNCIKNPFYINISLFDNFKSFISRQYAKKEDYYNFYDFMKWDEDKVVNTIRNEYDWEIATDTKATWRIGDGTAPFYNYIYYTVSGFTENDTFRSNQIREGMISREKALELVYEENKPRYESIKWYLEIIGLDFEATINKINSIPKLYLNK